MNEISADFAGRADFTVGERSSGANLPGIFLAEQARLKRIVGGMGLGVSEGQDVLQDVSIKALKWAGKLDSKEQCVRWLIKVTVNTCLTEHRRRRSFKRRTGEILKRRPQTDEASRGTDEKAIQAEELDMVRQSLQKLEAPLLAPLVLRYFCDLKSNEIGEILDLRASTVRSRLREARMTLAKSLLERGVEP